MDKNNGEDDDDDDYMSDKFIAASESTEKSIIKSAPPPAEHVVARMPRHLLEETRRREALEKPIDASNRGYSMLMRMGYKPGEALGVPTTATAKTASASSSSNDGDGGNDATAQDSTLPDNRLREPLAIPNVPRTTRVGIGGDDGVGRHTARQLQEEQEYERLKRLREEEVALTHAITVPRNKALRRDFTVRTRDSAAVRLARSDLRHSRLACEDLDGQAGVTDGRAYWLSEVVAKAARKKMEAELEAGTTRVLEDTDKRSINGGDGEDADDVHQQLNEVTAYLRQRHFYCQWCGVKYESDMDMAASCPGPTRHAHDDADADECCGTAHTGADEGIQGI